MLPSLPPLQLMFVFTETKVIESGCDTTIFIASAVQLLLSVTVTEYVSATKPVLSSFWSASFHSKVKPPAPPETVISISPSLPAKQFTSVTEKEITISSGCIISEISVAVQPLASVTTTVYVPIGKLSISSVTKAPLFQEYVYPGVPPETVISTAPLVSPKHCTSVITFVIVISEGLVTSIAGLLVAKQPLSSVTVMV